MPGNNTREKRRLRDYADIVRNLTEVLQERNREIDCLRELLDRARKQLYESRKNYQNLHHRYDQLEYNLFCETCKAHQDEPLEDGQTFE